MPKNNKCVVIKQQKNIRDENATYWLEGVVTDSWYERWLYIIQMLSYW